jgi:hypothetical protein
MSASLASRLATAQYLFKDGIYPAGSDISCAALVIFVINPFLAEPML